MRDRVPRYWSCLKLIAKAFPLVVVPLVVLPSSVSAASVPAASTSRPPCRGTDVTPGDDIQAGLDRNSEGATFCFRTGTYRLEKPLNPKANQQLKGSKDAVITGAKVITRFVPSGPNFVAPGFLPPVAGNYGPCVVAGCNHTQDIFLDGTRLTRVLNIADLSSGSYYEDYANNQIYLRDDPHNRLIEQAYAPSLIRSSNTGIVVEDLVLQMAAGEAQTGAVMATGPGWQIAYNDMRLNHGQGVKCASCVVKNNLIHHNGQMGMGGDHGSQDLVEGNEISYNNTAGYDPFWEAGGTKWSYMSGLIVRGNYVHDNHGTGLWTDTNNKSTVVEGNYVSSNDEHGIFHEIGYDAKLRNNIVVANGFKLPKNQDGWGGAGIRVAGSPDVEVYNNRVVGNRNGIVTIQQLRTEAADSTGPHEVKNLAVHDNDITMTEGVSGLVQDMNDRSYFSRRGNRFAGNHYHLDSSEAQRFEWEDRQLTAADWKRQGNDGAGTFDTSISAAPDPPALQAGPRGSSQSRATPRARMTRRP